MKKASGDGLAPYGVLGNLFDTTSGVIAPVQTLNTDRINHSKP